MNGTYKYVYATSKVFSQYACTYTYVYVHILVNTCFCTNSYGEKYLTDEVALESVKILTPWMKENQRNLFKNFCSTNWWKTHQFSCCVVSYSLQPHGLQHARLPCPSLLPGVFSNSCPSSQWCHPTILSSVAPLLLLPSVFPSMRVFSNELALCIQVDKVLDLQLQHQSFQWIFKVDFL